MSDFVSVTELPGTQISKEQLSRMFNRYDWTAHHCKGLDVLEVACGAGQGIGYIARRAKSIQAGDISDALLGRARAHYKDRFVLTCFDAQETPFEDDTFDAVVIHEALYYIPDANRFMQEVVRIMRPGGRLLITNSNKDLYDFNPSPHSTFYHGTVELDALMRAHGFEATLWGSQPLRDVSFIQKLTRPAKKLLVILGLFPKTMESKRFLKRIIFGKPVKMPSEIQPGIAEPETLTQLDATVPCRDHKTIYCLALHSK